ncbi:MAG: hypothetical protein EAX91_00065 [Candidatus Lokiarchaeota archaeon]|nr:hypothetical protein [Candidatus Lokiarchaeota archaeon]
MFNSNVKGSGKLTETYEEFIVYDLEDTGERTKLNIRPEELQSYLNPEQVLIIIREDLRRIYIWKGSKSPVRKRFISSRVAQDLQRDLTQDARYHRCKIISIDQGDELQEFLNAFMLESMEVTERLPDMRYVRNIERDRLIELERHKKEQKASVQKDNKEYYSLGLTKSTDDVVISTFALGTPVAKKKSKIENIKELSDEDKENIKEKILRISVPENLERQNLILGHKLYGAVLKVTDVLGENVKEIVWEEVTKLPKGVMELNNNIFRVYFNDKKGIIEAVEVLKKGEKAGKVEDNNNSSSPNRNLPKIPSDND